MPEINANFVIQPVELTTVVDSTDLTFTPSAINLTVSTVNKGESGFSGYSGFSGFSGFGATGPTGATGPQGATGISGFSGYSGFGATGPTGATGVSGFSGFSGWSGSPGGATGISGYSGYSGFTGATGAQGSVAGSNTQVQYNNDGNFAGSTNFTFDSSSNLVTITGNLVVTNSSNLANVSVSGTGFVKSLEEKITVANTAVGSSYNYNLIDQSIVYNTANANANITLNFRGNSTITANSYISNANSVIATFIVTTGNPGYGVTGVNIDGAARTINWAGNSVPNIVTNSTLSYTFTLLKTASNTYTVFGSQTRYG